MNKCDLEETKKQVDDLLDRAFEDADAWVYERVNRDDVWSSVYGIACNPDHPEVEVVFTLHDFSALGVHRSIRLNGIVVDSIIWRHLEDVPPRFRVVDAAYRRYEDEQRCKLLLTALNPPKRKKKEEDKPVEQADTSSLTTTLGAVGLFAVLVILFAAVVCSSTPSRPVNTNTPVEASP